MPLNPERLRTLRQFHAFTQKELARIVSVSQPTIADYEAGNKEPQPSVLDALATALRVDPRFLFVADDDQFDESEINFRRLVRTPETLKKKVAAQASLFGVVVRELRQHVPTLPPLNLPACPLDANADIESAAERARLHWGLGTDGPIHSMVDVLESAGVMLTVADAETAEKVDAFSRYGKTSVVVLNTAKGSASRTFFDTAHEAAHGVLCHHMQASKQLEQKEDEAQRFAGSFLMPKRPFTKEFWSRGSVDWANLLELKAHWGTSLAAIIVRAYQLGLIDAIAYRSAFRGLASRGWRTSEPEEPEPEFPKLFTLALQQYEKRTGRNVKNFVADAFFTPALFAAVTGHDLGSKQRGRVVSLSARRVG